MPDLAVLELRVSGAPATQTVKDFGNASEKATVQATGLEKAAMQQSAQFQRAHNITIASTHGMDSFSAINAEAAAHVGEHSLSVGRLERSMAMLTERAFGLNPQLVLLSESLGHFALGTVEMVGILGGLAAIAYAWKKLEDMAKEVEKATDDAIKKLTELRTKQQEGKFGSTFADRNRAQEELDDTNKQIAAVLKKIEVEKAAHVMSMSGNTGAVAGVGLPATVNELHRLQRHATEVRDLIIHADQEIAKITQDGIDEAERQQTEAAERDFQERKKHLAEVTKLYVEQLKAQQEAQKEGKRAFEQWQKDNPTDTSFWVDRESAKERAKASEEAWKRDAEASHRAMEQERQEAKKTADEMERSFAHFFESIATKGLNTFRQLFDDIKAMFVRMLAEMEAKELTKKMAGMIGAGLSNSGILAESLKMLAPGAGVGAGVGYLVGSSSGSTAAGMLSGAASGALVGAQVAGPIGAVVGAAAGLVGGFLGAKHGAEAAAEALLKMQRDQTQVAATLAQWRAQITGTAADQRAAALLGIKLQYMQIVAQIEQLEAGKKMEEQRNKDLAEAADLFGKAMAHAAGSVTGAISTMVNAVQGYKYQAAIFAASAAHNPDGSVSSNSTVLPITKKPGKTRDDASLGDLTVTLVLQDGSVLAKTVLKSFKAKAQQQFGDSTRWGSIQ